MSVAPTGPTELNALGYGGFRGNYGRDKPRFSASHDSSDTELYSGAGYVPFSLRIFFVGMFSRFSCAYKTLTRSGGTAQTISEIATMMKPARSK
jgi:hypothetical protein